MSHREIIERWLDVLAGATDRRGRPLRPYHRTSNVWFEDDTLYSYGRHFPLAHFLPAGRYRTRPLFLLNGDRFSNSTTRHQSDARGAVQPAADRFGADVIILPFSALDAARVDMATIRPLEVRPDRREVVESVTIDVDLDDIDTAGARWRSTVSGYGPDGPASWEVVRAEWTAGAYTIAREADLDGTWRRDPYARSDAGHILGSVDVRRNGAGWILERSEHRLGDSVFLATVSETVRRRRPCTVADVVSAALATVQNQSDARRWDVGKRSPSAADLLRDPLALLEPSAPIVETVDVRRRRRFLSAFDRNEPAPLYFLATLPTRSTARTVDVALEDLAPAAVHAAYARGRDVVRQGDIFGIATNLSDADIEAMTSARARLTQWTRSASARKGETGYRRPWSRSELERLPAARRRHYRRLMAQYQTDPRAGIPIGRRSMSGQWDHWRFCDRARAVSAWRHSLALAADDIRPDLAPMRALGDRERMRAVLAIHGTAHSATEVVRAAGAVYARGVMRHVPDIEAGRNGVRDHVNAKLGDGETWYLMVRNTVPRLRDAGRRR
jgi:hypothetical protein